MLLMLAFPGDQHLPISARPSMEVLLFAVCVAMATGVLFGLAPALIGAKTPPADAAPATTTSALSMHAGHIAPPLYAAEIIGPVGSIRSLTTQSYAMYHDMSSVCECIVRD